MDQHIHVSISLAESTDDLRVRVGRFVSHGSDAR